MTYDANGQEVAVSGSNQEWMTATVGVWDSSSDRNDIKNDVSYLRAPASGVIERKFISYDVPGATAMRFGVHSSGTITGSDAGSIILRAARVMSRYDGKQTF